MTYCQLPHDVMDELQTSGVISADAVVIRPGGGRAIAARTGIALSCRARAHRYAREGRTGQAEAFVTAAELVEAALGIAVPADHS